MKKTILLLILIITVAVLLTGCVGISWKLNDVYSTTESDEANKVFLSISNKEHAKKDLPITETNARLILSNESESDIELSLDYIIKREGKKGWIDLEKEYSASDETIFLKPGETYEFSIDWSDAYGKLERPGNYILIFSYSKPDGEHFATCEFGLGVPNSTMY